MSKAKDLTKNFGALSVIQAANYFIPFIVLPLIVRIIGPDKFGLLNFLTAFVTYFILFINYGFDYSATRTIAGNKQNKEIVDTVFSEVLFTKIALFVVSILLFSILFFCIPQLHKNGFVSILIFAGCFANVLLPNWLFQGMGDLRRFALFNLVAKIVFFGSMLFFIRQQEDYWLYALLSSLSQILVSVALFAYGIKRFNVQVSFQRIKNIRSVLKTDKMLFFSTLMINLYTTSNIVILGFMQPESEVGIYTAAARIIAVVQMLTLMPLSQTLFPHIGERFSENKEEGLAALRKVFPIVLLISLFVSVCLFITAPVAIRVLFGNKFESAIWILRLLSCNVFIVSISNLLGTQAMLNMKQDRSFFIASVIGSVCCIVLNLVLTPVYAAYGTAIAWVCTEIIIVICMSLMLKKLRVSLFDKRYFNAGYIIGTGKHLLKIARPKS
ncbi:MAG: flippase [Filimonas sp.]|nr:flippase [Filimonas sp.]